MPICTPCGNRIEEGDSYIAAIEREGGFEFRWGCEHHPIGDAAAYLGSNVCAASWALNTSPQAETALEEFLREKKEC